MAKINNNFKSFNQQFHFLSSRKFVALPHRGAHFFPKDNSDQYLENTHSAFSKAVELGFTHIETDVQKAIVKKIQEIITHFFDNLAHALSKELFIKPDRTKLNINEKPI